MYGNYLGYIWTSIQYARMLGSLAKGVSGQLPEFLPPWCRNKDDDDVTMLLALVAVVHEPLNMSAGMETSIHHISYNYDGKHVFRSKDLVSAHIDFKNVELLGLYIELYLLNWNNFSFYAYSTKNPPYIRFSSTSTLSIPHASVSHRVCPLTLFPSIHTLYIKTNWNSAKNSPSSNFRDSSPCVIQTYNHDVPRCTIF